MSAVAHPPAARRPAAARHAARTGPRRSPAPHDRQLDPERTKAALIDAALEEFAAKGFAGARVRDIAARAGVSKDLIAYHFGGKEGLYRAIERVWMSRKDAFVDVRLSVAENFARYLHDVLQDPRPLRLLVWRGLNAGADESPSVSDDAYPDIELLARRQQQGELDPDVDLATFQLAMMGAVAAPTLFPENVRRLFGTDATDPAFEARYRDGLLRLTHLTTNRTAQERS